MKHTGQEHLLGSMVVLRAYSPGQLDGYFRLPEQSKGAINTPSCYCIGTYAILLVPTINSTTKKLYAHNGRWMSTCII